MLMKLEGKTCMKECRDTCSSFTSKLKANISKAV